MAQSAIVSPQAICLGPTGEVEWSKAPDALDYTIMSVTKAFTCHYIAATGAFPGGPTDTVTLWGNTAQFLTGDVVTVDDLYHAVLLASDNGAADVIALASIGKTHTSFLGAKFLPEMNSYYETEFGWPGFNLTSPSGLGYNYATARQIAEMFGAIWTETPHLQSVMYKASYTTTVGGANPRSVTIPNGTGLLDVPEWRGSKGGSGSGTYAQGVLWEDINGAMHSIGIIGAPSAAQRKTDVLTIIADVTAGLSADPDPPTESGLFRTNGDPITLARTNGDPVSIT